MKLCWQTWPCMLNDALTFSIAVQTVRATSEQDPVLWGVTAERHIETDYHRRHTGISLKAPQPINEGKEGKERRADSSTGTEVKGKKARKQKNKARNKTRKQKKCSEDGVTVVGGPIVTQSMLTGSTFCPLNHILLNPLPTTARLQADWQKLLVKWTHYKGYQMFPSRCDEVTPGEFWLLLIKINSCSWA